MIREGDKIGNKDGIVVSILNNKKMSFYIEDMGVHVFFLKMVIELIFLIKEVIVLALNKFHLTVGWH